MERQALVMSMTKIDDWSRLVGEALIGGENGTVGDTQVNSAHAMRNVSHDQR